MATVSDRPSRAKRTRRTRDEQPAAPSPLPTPSPADIRRAIADEVTRLRGPVTPSGGITLDPPVRVAADHVPEGWQTAAPATIAPPARHGTMSITLSIGGTPYRLRPAKAGPPIEGVVTLAKQATDGPRPDAAYAIATDGLDIRCTCPDHERGGATCKHIGALVALARILAPFARTATEGGAL